MSSKLHHTCHVRKEVAEKEKLSKLLKDAQFKNASWTPRFCCWCIALKLLNNFYNLSDVRAIMLKYVTQKKSLSYAFANYCTGQKLWQKLFDRFWVALISTPNFEKNSKKDKNFKRKWTSRIQAAKFDTLVFSTSTQQVRMYRITLLMRMSTRPWPNIFTFTDNAVLLHIPSVCYNFKLHTHLPPKPQNFRCLYREARGYSSLSLAHNTMM